MSGYVTSGAEMRNEAGKIARTMETVALLANGGHNGITVTDGCHEEVIPGWWARVPGVSYE